MNFIESIKGYLKYLKLKKTKKKNSVYFFSESLNYRNYYFSIIKQLANKKDITVLYFTSDINDLESIEGIKPIFIGDGLIRMIFFAQLSTDMMIMTLTDLGNHEIKKSKNCKYYAYIFHSLVSTHKGYNKKSFDNYDIIFANGEYQKKELEKAEEIYRLKKKKIFVTGYPYYEYLNEKKINKIKNNKLKNNILFAPSWNKHGDNLLNYHASKIIETIIQKNKIIFRPHPQSLKNSKKQIDIINNKFKKNINYFFNKNIFNIDPLFKSSLLITDNGGMALEFSLIFKKPVIYIDFNDKIHNKDFKELNIEPIEDSFKKKFGYTLKIEQLNNLNATIEQIFKKSEMFENDYQNFFRENKLIIDKPSKNIIKIVEEHLK